MAVDEVDADAGDPQPVLASVDGTERILREERSLLGADPGRVGDDEGEPFVLGQDPFISASRNSVRELRSLAAAFRSAKR